MPPSSPPLLPLPPAPPPLTPVAVAGGPTDTGCTSATRECGATSSEALLGGEEPARAATSATPPRRAADLCIEARGGARGVPASDALVRAARPRGAVALGLVLLLAAAAAWAPQRPGLAPAFGGATGPGSGVPDCGQHDAVESGPSPPPPQQLPSEATKAPPPPLHLVLYKAEGNVSSLPASLLQPGAPLAECRWKWRRLRCLPASVCTLRRPPDWRSVLRIKAWHPCMPR